MIFDIDYDLLAAIDQYDVRSKILQNNVANSDTKLTDDELMNFVPIYDTANRRFASFCSFTEAIWHKDSDVKKNGIIFKEVPNFEFENWIALFYLFRVCGSGINYRPKKDANDILKSHGFGNFWVIDSILQGSHTLESWIEDLNVLNKPFTDNKGYLLPQFSFSHLEGGHLKYFISNFSQTIVKKAVKILSKGRVDNFVFVDLMNEYLLKLGLKRQTFIFTALACDISEYFPTLIDGKSNLYVGTNAKKCLNVIFKKKEKRSSEFEFHNEALSFLAQRYDLNPSDCEDSRACDIIRYFQEYQSEHHVAANNGTKYKNNCNLKTTWGLERYYQFSQGVK